MYMSNNYCMGNIGRGRPASDVPTGSNFGAWLRRVRTERGLTGEALAFKVGGGLTQSSISHYERGAKKPEAGTVFLLAQALCVDPQEALRALMADTPGLSDFPALSSSRTEAVEMLDALTDEQYNTIVKPLLMELARGKARP